MFELFGVEISLDTPYCACESWILSTHVYRTECIYVCDEFIALLYDQRGSVSSPERDRYGIEFHAANLLRSRMTCLQSACRASLTVSKPTSFSGLQSASKANQSS